MPVAELFLSAFLTVVFEKLASGDLLDFARQEGIHVQLKKWTKTLSKIQAVLSDAEEKQITDKAVKLWLEDLRDLAYDLDDVLDDFATEALRRRLMNEPHTSRRSKVPKLLPTCCTSFSPTAVMFNYNMRSKLEEITGRLQELIHQKNDMDLKENVGGRSSRPRERLPTTSLVDESRVYGREKDKQAILDLMFRDCEKNDAEACVIPVVGMGGVGKSTLAQLVYNDDKVKELFDLKVWASVSEEFDVFNITKMIFEAVASENRDIRDLNMIQVSLQEKLSKKRFLIVLDDVWNENYDKWDLLRGPLRVGAPGSKIIVTTRNEGVASMMGSVPPYHLKELANDDCLSLLAQHALGLTNFDSWPELKVTGENLARKCKGLPLAAKTLGGLLRSKVYPKEWEDILYSKIWDIPEEKSEILPVLRLSYYHLPSSLKHLFAYCAILPKDYEFEKDELVLLWMGEGFLCPSDGKKQMEELGDEYFNELLSRSLFQHSSGSKTRFVMHDLINDLAQFVAGDICFRLDEKQENSCSYRVSEKARHASYIRRQYETFKRFKAFQGVEKLRTCLALQVHKSDGFEKSYVTKTVLSDFLSRLLFLRVLSLCGYSITELPSCIGDLKHLRYLNLSETSLKQLPETICSLYNLQILLLRGCFKLTKLPAGLGNLIGLRHLDIADTEQLQEMPLGIDKLTSLQTLSKITVAKCNGLQLKDLRSLDNLSGSLYILGLQNVVDIKEAAEANLVSKSHLDELIMRWTSDSVNCLSGNHGFEILSGLKPQRELKKLSIEFYDGTEFPSWIGDPSFCKLQQLTLSGCSNCTSLPVLGRLPSLKELHIQGMTKVLTIDAGFYAGGGFPSLEILKFEDMLQWEEWSSLSDSDFPCLLELSLCNCPKLYKVHVSRLPYLQELNLEECQDVVLKSMVGLSSLNALKIRSIYGLSELPESILQCCKFLEDLDVIECGELVSLWGDEASGNLLVNLKSLGVYRCKGLKFLVGENQALPCSLESLSICDCPNFEKLPNKLVDILSLRELRIISCPKFASFPENGIACMLTRLEIGWCEALECLPCDIVHLEELEIEACPSLKSIAKERLPATLKLLQIYNCAELQSASEATLQESKLERLRISDWPNFMTLLKSVCSFPLSFECLVELHISRCPGVVCFPEGFLSIHNLRHLSIWSCINFRTLPDQFQNLTSLESLMLHDCPSLVDFPQQDLPRNLMSLWISNCEGVIPLPDWGLHRLTSLQRLTIHAEIPDVNSFPGDCLLPESLTSLRVARLLNLESISKGLQSLVCLERLIIRDCPKLRHLPNGNSLARLSYLEIGGCPLLAQKCFKEKGEYWPKIALIPCVYVNGSLIHEQGTS